MDKVATLTILAIFSVTISHVVTMPRNILHQNNHQEVQNTPGVSNNMKNLLLGVMKRGGLGCILNLGLSHNCDYEAAIGKGICKKKVCFNHFFLYLWINYFCRVLTMIYHDVQMQLKRLSTGILSDEKCFLVIIIIIIIRRYLDIDITCCNTTLNISLQVS